MSFCVRSIRIFSKFSGDPYYEPLSWFMILRESFEHALISPKTLSKVTNNTSDVSNTVDWALVNVNLN